MVIAKCMKNPPENSENIHYQPAKINKKKDNNILLTHNDLSFTDNVVHLILSS